MPCKFNCPCRIGLDWISGIVELLSLIFFLSGFGTKYWAVSEDGSIHSGLFTTCTTDVHILCYASHNYYHSSAAKGRVMGAAVIEIFTTCGLLFVLLLMLLYMCGLFEEKAVGRLAALTSYITSFFGFLGVILFGAGANSIDFSVGWSMGLVILGLLLNIVAGIFIHIGSNQYVDEKLFQQSKHPRTKSAIPPLPPIRPQAQVTSRFSKMKLSA
ncbi:uncharacterized protein LOC134691231 [Mytilus trossulus]|uniref:uncharacterized protein LOC134691231 n=1 Tax=Mytilus trossulus TaxID=6551 RepID=UPI003005AB98